MNIQAIMKQAQKIQNDMAIAKEEIDKTIYEGKASFVTATLKGNKEIIQIKINNVEIQKDEIEMLEDMLVIAINDAMKKIDKDTEEKIGKYAVGMPGLF